MSYRNIIYEVQDRIAWITLNRPEKLNAIDDAMLRELDQALARAEPDLDVKVIVIKGAGRAFSVGVDLSGEGASEVMSLSPGTSLPTKDLLATARRWNRRWEYIFNICKPTIAQVHGYCLGMACSVSMVCDITIAAEDAIFGDPTVRMGGLPAMPLWPWLVGAKKAKELLYSGRYITGKEAEEIGLINAAVPADRLEEEVHRLAQGVSLLPADALALVKDSINSTMEARGLGPAWRFTDEMLMVAQSRSLGTDELDFFALKDREGLERAIEARDTPFRDLGS